MKSFAKRILPVFILIIVLFNTISIASAALTFDGNAGAGAGGSLTASGGYAVASVCIKDGNVRPTGYRFTVVNVAGNPQYSGPYDIFRSLTDTSAINASQYTVKTPKTTLKTAYQTGSFSTGANGAQESLDSSLGLTLPQFTSELESWCISSNLNVILDNFSSGLRAPDLATKGLSLLIEPIYSVTLENQNHSLTVTEIAAYGAAKFGASAIPSSSNTSGSWSFIASYTNRYFPNSLKVETGHGLFAANPATLTSNTSFANIVENGYGVAILYGDNLASPAYTVSYDANGGSGAPAAQGKYHGVDLTMSSIKPTRTGYTFKCWNTQSDGNGWDKDPGDFYYSDASGTLYAIWTPNTYTVKYNGNGYTSGSTANSTHTYDKAKALTANGFTKTGHTFAGWNTKADSSGTSYSNSQSVKNLTATNNGTVNLYAIWTPNTVKIAYNVNGGTLSSDTYNKKSNGFITDGSTVYFDSMSYGESDDPYNASTLGLTRTGYKFAGWKVRSTGTVLDQDTDYASTVYAQYDDKAKTTSNTASVVCYLDAQWTPNTLTVNYYSNYATESFSGALNTVGADKNVIVRTTVLSYDAPQNYGLWDYVASTTETYLGRTGYKATGNWGTSTSGGTLVNENTSFATTQALAKALGKDISSGNATVNIYAQWTENKLTVKYYSNGATASFNEPLNAVGEGKNVHVKTISYYYDNEYNTSLQDYTYSSATCYLDRNGHVGTGYWGTTTTGGTKVHQETVFTTGQKLAELFGKSLETDSVTISIYPQWRHVAGYIDGYSGEDGIIGNDSNTGTTPSDPVKTFKQAYTNLKDTGGTIYVVDTVEISDDVTLTSSYYQDSSGKITIADGKWITIKRYSKPTAPNNDAFNVASNTNTLIKVNDGGNLTINNIIIDGHKNPVVEGSENQIAEGVTAEAALVVVEKGVLNIQENAVLQENNNPAGKGGGVYVMSDGTLNMTGGLIQSHNVEFGGGIANEGTLNLTKGIITSNVAYWKSGYLISGNGGGIYSTKSFTLPEGVVIQNNTAINGGGVYIDTDYDALTEDVAVLTFDGAEISGNIASDGAGVLVAHSNMIMKSGKITENQAGDCLGRKSYGYGGGISVSGNRERDRGILTILGGEISNNTVVASYGAYGGAVYSHWATINMEGGILTNNSCTGGNYSEGGGIFLNERSILNMTGGTISKNSAEEGGGVALIYYYDSTANFSGNAIVTENTATYSGGGVYNYGCGAEGGGIFVEGNARIDKNTAQWGGGIFCDYGHATIAGGTITENSASEGGGAYLYNESVGTLTSNSIFSNNADLGSGVYVCGAGEYNDISTFKMYDAACVGDTDRDGVSDTDEVYLEDGCYILVPSEFSNVSTDSAITTSKKALRAIVVPSTTDLGRVIAKFGDESSTEGKKALYWNPDNAKMTEQYFVVEGKVLRSGDQGASGIDSIGVTARDVFISEAYDVIYNANGGSNAPSAQTKFWNENITLSTKQPTRDSFLFGGWNSATDGSGTVYTPGAVYAENADLTLYARWGTEGVGYKTIMVGDLVDPEGFINDFVFPAGSTIDTFDVIYNGVPRDEENKATTTGNGYTIVYDIVFSDSSTGQYNLIVMVLDESLLRQEMTGYIRFISFDFIESLETNSKWRTGDLKTRLEKTLSIKEPTDDDAVQVWRFSVKDVQDIKDWVKKNKDDGVSRKVQNEGFFAKFAAKCKIK